VRPLFCNFALSKKHNPIQMEITVKTAEQLRLTAQEFELIKEKLGRYMGVVDVVDVDEVETKPPKSK
jgi:hypothetical protein